MSSHWHCISPANTGSNGQQPTNAVATSVPPLTGAMTTSNETDSQLAAGCLFEGLRSPSTEQVQQAPAKALVDRRRQRATSRPRSNDPTTLVKGPFSADFRWVALPDWPHGTIRLTPAQTAVFEALWSFEGEPRAAERIMRRAGLDIDKPIGAFTVKARDKGKPEAEGTLFAYRVLMAAQRREGLYSIRQESACRPAVSQR